MKNIFIISAGGPLARGNYEKTVLRPIPKEHVLTSFPVEMHGELLAWQQQAGGFFAWGNRTYWALRTMLERLEAGDCILTFYDCHYQFISRLLGRVNSAELAEKEWGSRQWSEIIFMTQPRKVNVPASALVQYLGKSYRVPMRMSDQRIQRIITHFGSVENFITEKFGAV